MFRISCKNASMWLLRLQEQDLSWFEHVRLRAHLMACHRCRHFGQQMDTLSQGMHIWRNNIDNIPKT